jgi:DNA-binding PadR family transcriptional regulator
MEQYRKALLERGSMFPCFGTSQIKVNQSSPQVTPILDWLVREGYVKRLDPVFGPNRWERAWAVTQKGREYLRESNRAAA